MKKKIVINHVIAFLVGAVAIVGYFFVRITALKGAAGLAVIPLIPAAVVYIIAFGILCAFSCAVFLMFRKK